MRILVSALARVNTRNRDGGAVRFTEVASELARRGHDIVIVAPDRQVAMFETDGLAGVTYRKLSDPIGYEGEQILLVLAIYLVRLVQAAFARVPAFADIVYAPSDFLVDLLPALWWARRSRCPSVVFVGLVARSPIEERSWRLGSARLFRQSVYFATQRMAFWLMRLSGAHAQCLNSADAAALRRAGLRHVHQVSMGVDVDAPARSGRPEFDAIWMGRLHPQKGIDDLIPIWRIVTQERPAAKLALIGGGSNDVAERLRREIDDSTLAANVVMLGFVSGPERFRRLAQARVFVMPSSYEAFGQTIIEAAAVGLPVVAYDLPIYGELFSGGVLTAPLGDHAAFAGRVLQVLDDPNMAQRVSEAGRKTAALYSWKAVADFDEGLFVRIAGDARMTKEARS